MFQDYVDFPRHCKIEQAGIEEADGGGDGCYELIDAEGTPDEIGEKIAEALKHNDLSSGSHHLSYLERGEDLFLTIKIRFTKAGVLDFDPCI